jgi:hypothetical protein
MKIWLLVVVLVVSGIVTGIGSAVFRVRSSGWDSESLNSPLPSGVSRAPEEKAADTGPPVATVDSDVHDFGVMEASKSGTHDFVISNDGASELELTGGGTTCKCTLSKISKRKIPPGESSKITVDWKGKNNAGEFRHTATILTNDGHNPKIVLTIEGRMTGIFRSSPQELTFSRVSAGESVVGNVKLFSYVDKPLEISEHRVSDPEHLEVSIAPLSEEEIARELDAKSGKLLRVTLKSGLPLGRFMETITLDTNLDGLGPIGIPVEGIIGSDISIVGPRWSADNSTLHISVVDPAVGAEATLLIIVGGANRKEIEFKLGSVLPDMLEAELGEPTDSPDGRRVMRKLTIRVPKGSRPAVYLGPGRENLGCVSIETTSQGSPDLNVYVNFAVGG